MRETIEFISEYNSDCKKGIISYTSDDTDVYEYTLNRFLDNIYLIAVKTIRLYDNQSNSFTKAISKYTVSKCNDILRAALESIRDTALDYKDGTRKYSVPDDLSDANKYLLNKAMNEIESIANHALTLYCSDLINHSEQKHYFNYKGDNQYVKKK